MTLPPINSPEFLEALERLEKRIVIALDWEDYDMTDQVHDLLKIARLAYGAPHGKHCASLKPVVTRHEWNNLAGQPCLEQEWEIPPCNCWKSSILGGKDDGEV